jgi:hypothetical protein
MDGLQDERQPLTQSEPDLGSLANLGGHPSTQYVTRGDNGTELLRHNARLPHNTASEASEHMSTHSRRSNGTARLERTLVPFAPRARPAYGVTPALIEANATDALSSEPPRQQDTNASPHAVEGDDQPMDMGNVNRLPGRPVIQPGSATPLSASNYDSTPVQGSFGYRGTAPTTTVRGSRAFTPSQGLLQRPSTRASTTPFRDSELHYNRLITTPQHRTPTSYVVNNHPRPGSRHSQSGFGTHPWTLGAAVALNRERHAFDMSSTAVVDSSLPCSRTPPTTLHDRPIGHLSPAHWIQEHRVNVSSNEDRRHSFPVDDSDRVPTISQGHVSTLPAQPTPGHHGPCLDGGRSNRYGDNRSASWTQNRKWCFPQ